MQYPLSLETWARLPAPVAYLAVCQLWSLVSLTDAHVLPIETTTIEFRVLDVLPIPAPTPAPLPPKATRRRRQLEEGFNTICGYIGGDPDLPATCSLGSHCVVDNNVGAIGCCPDVGLCTTGVFTGCVDGNSPPQTEVNPYVFTCSGSDVCYMNRFDGGNFQYGCGSASDLAASVIATASGATNAPPIQSVSALMTEDPVSLSEPTTIGTRTRPRSISSIDSTASSSSTVSSTSSFSRTSTSSDSASTTSSSDPTGTSAPVAESSSDGAAADGGGGGGGTNQGAIIGGSIGGAAALIGLVAAALFLCRRRRGRNTREGPGPKGDTQYISPMSKNRNFTPVAPNQESYEQSYMAPPNGTTTTILGGKAFADPGRHPVLHTTETAQPDPYSYVPSGGAIPTDGQHNPYDPHDDRVPLNQEYSDFSRGFNDALSRIEEEESRPATSVNHNGMSGFGNGYGAGADSYEAHGAFAPRGGEGPLWQQNRRKSRNMMWMQQ